MRREAGLVAASGVHAADVHDYASERLVCCLRHVPGETPYFAVNVWSM